MQVSEALKGQGPLFTVRVTTLGDGHSILAVTWIHGLADGERRAARCPDCARPSIETAALLHGLAKYCRIMQLAGRQTGCLSMAQ